MKINEVEAAVGVTKKNIRFYEEEGLISPRREPGNGYRSYSEADVERLRRIKLLRKLDVPLAEIRQMLEGECTLAEGMTRQLERLHTRRTDLDEAVNFCTLLQKEPVSLNELDVEQTLARLTAKEEQGVTFVDIEQVDRKAERIRGALVGAGLFTAIMLLSIGIMAWAFCVDPQDVPPLPLLVVLFGIPAGCIIGTLKVLVGYEYGTNYLGAPVLGLVVWCVVCFALNTLLDLLYEKTGCIWVPAIAHGAFNAIAALPQVLITPADAYYNVLGPMPIGLISVLPMLAVAVGLTLHQMKQEQ